MEALNLEVDRVSVTYGNYHAVREVSFALPQGQYVLLIGENGAGKSTLLRCAAGWQRPLSGAISVFGTVLEEDERRARQGIKLVPDTPQFYAELTAWEHVAWIAQAHRIGDWQSTAETLLEAFAMASNKDAYPSSFSRGMQYKLALVMSLIAAPKLLLLDEPFGPLDPYSQQYLASHLRKIADAGVTILASTHVLPEAEPPDRLMVLSQGQVIEDYTWEEISKAYPDVTQASIPTRVLRDALKASRGFHDA